MLLFQRRSSTLPCAKLLHPRPCATADSADQSKSRGALFFAFFKQRRPFKELGTDQSLWCKILSQATAVWSNIIKSPVLGSLGCHFLRFIDSIPFDHSLVTIQIRWIVGLEECHARKGRVTDVNGLEESEDM